MAGLYSAFSYLQDCHKFDALRCSGDFSTPLPSHDFQHGTTFAKILSSMTLLVLSVHYVESCTLPFFPGT